MAFLTRSFHSDPEFWCGLAEGRGRQQNKVLGWHRTPIADASGIEI
jgi:hypothetical protein